MREKIHATETTCIFLLYMANIVRVQKEVKKKKKRLNCHNNEQGLLYLGKIL